MTFRTLACSHALLVSDDVPRMMAFVKRAFRLDAHFENPDFGEFVLPSGFRLAIFRATGAAGKFFDAKGTRGAASLGFTVTDVDAFYRELEPALEPLGATHCDEPYEPVAGHSPWTTGSSWR